MSSPAYVGDLNSEHFENMEECKREKKKRRIKWKMKVELVVNEFSE